MMNESDWAEEVYGQSTLPDKRLKRRLVEYGARQATEPTASTAKACDGDVAQREGAYRFLENERVDPAGIDEGPYQHCVRACAGKRRLLAIQDTSSVRVHHAALADELAETGSPTGFLAHTLMIVDPDSGVPLGIADQKRWVREKKRPRKGSRKERAYQDKESVRWQESLERACQRLDPEALISVCDREADIYEFLAYHIAHAIDFVIRASWNRRVSEEINELFEAAREAPVVGHRTIRVEQRGAQPARNGQRKREARKRRDVDTQIQATSVQIRPPKNRATELGQPLDLHVVRVVEIDPPEGNEPLEWILLTRLPIDTEEQVTQIVEYYEYRWLIEEFHKCWKTGCRLETRPLQSLDAVERMMALMAPIGLRILQMKQLANRRDADDTPAPLDDDEWRCLWTATSKQPLPSTKPSARWAFLSLAKLGGFYDSKRTGRPGWSTLWSGWAKFQVRLEGWRAATRANQR